MMEEVDPDHTGNLDFIQYMKMMESMFKEWNLKEKLLEAFKVFDSTDSGTVAASELKHVMTSLEVKLSEADADEMASSCLSTAPDASGGDRINYEALVTNWVELMNASKGGGKGKTGKGSKKGKGKKKKKK